MFNFEQALERLSEQTILCIGDLMLDDFIYGEVSRVSPEAPVPVIAVKREEKVIGGAGNVARNIASLGVQCIFIGVIGGDDAGQTITSKFAEFKRTIEPHLVVDRSRPRRRSCSTGRWRRSAAASGVARASASASPMAASIFCIPAMSRC